MPRTKHTQGKGRHGLLKDGVRPPEHAIWKMMIQRCLNPKSSGYQKFGGRGIRVAERWLEQDGFANFLADVGPQPFPGAGLRRLDPIGHFEPGNVEWGATRGDILRHDGRSMSVAAWAEQLGVKASTLRARRRNGWSIEKTLTRPVARRPHSSWWNRRKKNPTQDEDDRPKR